MNQVLRPGAGRRHLRGTGWRWRSSRAALAAAMLSGLIPAAAGAQGLPAATPGNVDVVQLALTESFAGIAVKTPVRVVNGLRPGPTVCLVAGIHGDEINGIDSVQGLVEGLDPQRLAGRLVAVPIANVPAFRTGSRYLPDRRDLNRYFPGNDHGSLGSRVAHALFDGVFKHCGLVLDFHTGSDGRTNLPQARGDADDPCVRSILRAGGALAVHKAPHPGSLRAAMAAVGVPAVVFEAGEANRIDRHAVAAGKRFAQRVLRALGVLASAPDAEPNARIYGKAGWERTDAGGISIHRVGLDHDVHRGQVLAEVHDPLTGQRVDVYARHAGRVIGLALNQTVMPGFGIMHIARQSSLLADGPSVLPTGGCRLRSR